MIKIGAVVTEPTDGVDAGAVTGIIGGAFVGKIMVGTTFVNVGAVVGIKFGAFVGTAMMGIMLVVFGMDRTIRTLFQFS